METRDEAKASNLAAWNSFFAQEVEYANHRFGCSKLIIPQVDEPLACLGVPPVYWNQDDSDDSGIDPNSVYGKLHRPGILPGRLKISLENEKFQAIAQAFWDGKCTYYLIPPNVEDTTVPENGIRYLQPKWLPVEPEGFDGETMFQLMASAIHQDEQVILSLSICIQDGHSSFKRGQFNSLLIPPSWDASFNEALCCRVIHHFLRHYGFMVPRESISFICNTVGNTYTTKATRRESLDLCLLEADLLHATPSPYDIVSIGSMVGMVGNALESLGHFEQAATLYMEVAQQYQAGSYLEPHSLADAALAYAIARQCSQAFGCYTKALKVLDARLGGSWDFKGDQEQFFIIALYKLYHVDLAERVIMGGGIQKDTTPEDIACSAFKCLLDAAGDILMEEDTQTNPHESMLKHENRTPGVAKQILVDMFKTGSHSDYTKMLLAVMRPVKFSLHSTLDIQNYIAQTSKQFSLHVRKYSKAIQRLDQGEQLSCATCKEKKLYCKTLLRCPCKSEYYCSKECQRKTWKEHKTSCSWYLEKQGNRLEKVD